jgi:hypothetical protein
MTCSRNRRAFSRALALVFVPIFLTGQLQDQPATLDAHSFLWSSIDPKEWRFRVAVPFTVSFKRMMVASTGNRSHPGTP